MPKPRRPITDFLMRALAPRLDRRLNKLEEQLAIHMRESRLIYEALTLPDRSAWTVNAPEGRPLEGVFYDHSAACREVDFNQPWFRYWTERMGESLRYHRKLWEFVFVCQALYERGLLRAGHKGLGFGVGEEPLPALFAAHGCDIVATDLSRNAAASIGWADTAQHAGDRDMLRRPHICADDVFNSHVSFRDCDMTAVPDDLTGFDFCWSACALEHLGSIAKGADFIERSLACLKPGGYAVHTTEFNVSSNEDTVDHMGTVLYRRRDFEALATRLRAQGHEVAPLDFDPGMGVIDGYVDLPPYRDQPILKFALAGYVTTSFGIVVRKAV